MVRLITSLVYLVLVNFVGNNMKKIIALLVLLTSCVGESGTTFENLLKPGGRFMSYMPAGASDAYQARSC